MATTSKKSASKKTKTQKSASSRTSAKTSAKSSAAAKKTTAKSTSKKAAAKMTAKKISAENAVYNTEAKTEAEVASTVKPAKTFRGASTIDRGGVLRRWNFALALLYIAQGAAIVALTKAGRGLLSITTNYFTADSLASSDGHTVMVTATRRLVDIRLSWLIPAFFGVLALAHFSNATWYRARYERDLGLGINRMRWLAGGLAGGLMLITVGMLSGMSDLALLLALLTLVGVSSLLAFAMERFNSNTPKDNVNWLTSRIGLVAGVVAWLLVVIYAFGTHQFGAAEIPRYMYWIYATMLVLSGLAVLIFHRHFQERGRWADYMNVERAFIVLSFIASTALAWQVYAGTLQK